MSTEEMDNIKAQSKPIELETSNTPNVDKLGRAYATGRRKTSIAKVWLKKGSGKIYVNGKLYSDYFSNDNHKMQITRPFEIIN